TYPLPKRTLPSFTIAIATPAILSRSSCSATNPSRNASTSLSVIGCAVEGAGSGFCATGIFGVSEFTFDFWPRDRIEKHSKVAATASMTSNCCERFSNKKVFFSCCRFIGFSVRSLCRLPFRNKRAVGLEKDQLIHLATRFFAKFHAESAESLDSKFKVFLPHKGVGRLARNG